MQTRRASIKETGEELSQADWERFDAAVAQVKAERLQAEQAARMDRSPTPLRKPAAAKSERGV